MIALKSKGTTGLNHSSTFRESSRQSNPNYNENNIMNAEKAEYRFLEEGLRKN